MRRTRLFLPVASPRSTRVYLFHLIGVRLSRRTMFGRFVLFFCSGFVSPLTAWRTQAMLRLTFLSLKMPRTRILPRARSDFVATHHRADTHLAFCAMQYEIQTIDDGLDVGVPPGWPYPYSGWDIKDMRFQYDYQCVVFWFFFVARPSGAHAIARVQSRRTAHRYQLLRRVR